MASSLSSSVSLPPPPSLLLLPAVVRDARFVAGRATVGQANSIAVFATLLREAKASYGDDSLETAPAYYEYGNALFRFAQRQQQQQQQEDEEQRKQEVTLEETVSSLSPPSKAGYVREAAAAAAERRAMAATQSTTTTILPPLAATSCSSALEKTGSAKIESNNNNKRKCAGSLNRHHDDYDDDDCDDDDHEFEGDDGVFKGDDNEFEGDDIQLALEMMETAWSVLDGEVLRQKSIVAEDNNDDAVACTPPLSSQPDYRIWVTEQVPRVLTGIGDILSALGRHADATDAYLRALAHRQTDLDLAVSAAATDADSVSKKDASSDVKEEVLLLSSSSLSLTLLQCRRKLVEANILIVEELLACEKDKSDVVTSESKDLLVKAGHVVEYARGYYDKARDELQEAVVLLGQMAADAAAASRAAADTNAEKENLCFVATMVMGAGMALTEIDEKKADEQQVKKRAKNR